MQQRTRHHVVGSDGAVTYYVDDAPGIQISDDGPTLPETFTVQIDHENGATITLDVSVRPDATTVSDTAIEVVAVHIEAVGGVRPEHLRMSWEDALALAVDRLVRSGTFDPDPDPDMIERAVRATRRRRRTPKVPDHRLDEVADAWRHGGADEVMRRFGVANRTAYNMRDRAIAAGLLDPDDTNR